MSAEREARILVAADGAEAFSAALRARLAERKARILIAADGDFLALVTRSRTKEEKLRAINKGRLAIHRILEDAGSYDNPEVEELAAKWREHVEATMPSFAVRLAKVVNGLSYTRRRLNRAANKAMTKLPTESLPPARDILGQYLLLIAGLLCFGMILFPPFYLQDGGERQNLGYGFLFSPPKDEYDDRGSVNVSLLVTQMVVVLASAGLAYAGRGALLDLTVRVTRKSP